MRAPIKYRFISAPLYLIIFFLCGYWALFQPKMGTAWLFFSNAYLYLFILFILLFAPFYKIKLSHPELTNQYKSKPFPIWWLQCFSVAILLLILQLSIQFTIVSFGPYASQIHISPEHYWQYITHHYHFWDLKSILSGSSFGVSVWAMIILWSVALSYVTYYKKSVPCTPRIVASILKGRPAIWAKAFCENNIHLSSLSFVSLMLLSAIILIASGLMEYLKLPSYFTISMITISFFSLIILWTLSKSFKELLRQCARFHFTFAHLVLVLALISIPLLTISSFLISKLLHLYPGLLSKVQCDCMPRFLLTFLDDRMEGLFIGCWLVSIPIASSLISRLSYGRTILEMLLGLFMIPVVLFMADGVLAHFTTFSFGFVNGDALLKVITAVVETPLYQMVVGLFLLATLITLLWGRNTSWIFNNGFMKQPLDYKTGEISLFQGTKIRGISFTARKFILVAFMLIFVNTVGGWVFMEVEVLMLVPIILYMFYFGLIGFITEVFKSSSLGQA